MQLPISEILKSIPGALGIRLEDELPYRLIKQTGNFELRHYNEFTLARTSVTGDYDKAGEVAFKRLADFIFGSNRDRVTSKMTTPVFMDKTNDGWIMSFYLEPEFEFLEPINHEIRVEKHPEKDVAVYRYSGLQTEAAMEESKEKLLEFVRKENLSAISEVWWAQYDQPVSIPATKRNEALVKISKP